MNQLQYTIGSLEVAEMVGREHRNVIQDIRKIIEHLGELKNQQSYFIESTYKNTQNKELPCFLLTKKGCELYSTRMTGAKGTQFAVAYIERFNDMENELKQQKTSLPTSYKEALQHLLIQVEENEKISTEKLMLEQQVGELKPKADYTDRILKSTGLITVSQIAKDYGMSAKIMNLKLHELGVQYYQNKQWLLYSKHHDKGYTHSNTIEITHSDGRPGTVLNTKWTQKGRLFLYELLKQEGIIPVIERDMTPV